MKTFVEAYWDQEAVEEDIDNWVEMWHFSDEGVTLDLHEYLGLTRQDCTKWSRDPEELRDILHKDTYKPSKSPIPFVYLVLDSWGEVVSNLGTKNKIYTKKGNAEALCKRHKGSRVAAYKLVEVPTVK